MTIYTYEITLVNGHGAERTVEVMHTDCISAKNKARDDFGDGWEIKDCRLVRVD